MTAAVSAREAGAESAVTAEIARRAAALRYDALPQDIRLLARQCLLDWLAVTLAGAGEELSRILRDDAAEQGGSGAATLILGEKAAERLAQAVADLDNIGSMTELTRLCVPA
jgi:2-methylcitrate dehydratase PrpD